MREEVEQRPLGGQDLGQRPLHPGDHVTGGHPVAVAG
jgi:hypothetical protein